MTFEKTIKKIGLRNVQNSLCLMYLKQGNKKLAKESIITTDINKLKELVIGIK